VKFIDGLTNLAALHAGSASGRDADAVYFKGESSFLFQGRKQLSTLDHDKDVSVMDTLDIALRLSAASIVGVVLDLTAICMGRADYYRQYRQFRLFFETAASVRANHV
jgi:hypothetical protein